MKQAFNLSLSLFGSINNDTRYRDLLEEAAKSPSRLLAVLEFYKIVDIDELCSVFNQYNTDTPLSNVKEFKPLRDISFELPSGVLVGNLSNGRVDIIQNICELKATEDLEMRLSGYDIRHVYVTPGCYNMLITSSGLSKKSLFIEKLDYLLLFKRIIIDCVDKGGTDIHFDTLHINKQLGGKVSYRIGNRLVPCTLFELGLATITRMLKEVVSKSTSAVSLDLDRAQGAVTNISDAFNDGITDLRITGNPSLGGYHVVLRVQDKATVSLKISELGFDEHILTKLRALSIRHTGLTLITGPVRSGKNTTAFAMTNEMLSLNKGIKIVDYSSPVEVLMPFTQIDYRSDVENLKACIALAKKQDIDLAIINEIPNSDVAFAIQGLVNSSIGVITTTHLDRVWHVPYKFYELFAEQYKNVFGQLNAVINQKMFVKQCPFCGTVKDILEHPRGSLYKDLGAEVYREPAGCNKCSKYEGKLQPYVELINFTTEVRNMVYKSESVYDLSLFLESTIKEAQQNMEVFVIQDVTRGLLPVSSLDTFC